MAKKKTNEEQGEPLLLIARWDAKNLISDRIKIGKGFLNFRIPSLAILDDERTKYYNWSKYNAQLLSKIFSSNSVSEEYTYWGGIMFAGGQTSLQEEIKEHFDEIKEKIRRLESIIERLELFEEASSVTNKESGNNMTTGSKKIFIIHGHDETRLLELEKMLKDDFKLTPIILKDQPDGGAGLGGGYRITSYTQDSKSWYTNNALLGIYTETGNKSLSLDFRFSLGVQQVKSPEAHIYEQGYTWQVGPGVTAYYKKVETQPALVSYNLVGNLGIDCNYSFAKRYNARIGIENFFSQAKFDGNQTYTTDTDYTNGATEHSEAQNELHFTKNVFLFCINVGIGYVIK